MADHWPDPSRWVSDLQHELRALDTVFLTYEGIRTRRTHYTQDDLDRLGIEEPIEAELTHQYARVVSRLIEALEKLPPFVAGEGLAALRGLRLDLWSLDDGGLPDRLQPRPATSKGGDNRGQRVAKAHMVAYVHLFEELGLSNTQARKTVAGFFQAENFAVSASSLFRWAAEIAGASDDGPLAGSLRRVKLMLAQWKADAAWPFTIEQAKHMTQRAASGVTISLAHTT